MAATIAQRLSFIWFRELHTTNAMQLPIREAILPASKGPVPALTACAMFEDLQDIR